jgi:methylglutaconyl-CoA hydratase
MQTITYSQQDSVGRVLLNRPDVHNAFNRQMIRELITVFKEIAADDELRVVVLAGAGKSFCAGADLNWMRQIKDYSYEENLRESQDLAEMLHSIYASPKPVVARVQGAAIGGGTGLVAVCDIAVAARDARFSFSEVKLGLIPACISPYVLKKCGEGRCREFFLTGERLTAEKALAAGLVSRTVEPTEMDGAVDEIVAQLLSSGPEAIRKCKELLSRVPEVSFEEARQYTAEVIAQLRISPEAQEGMASFLEKRPPAWHRRRPG